MKITPFLFENAKLVRTIERDAEPWFVAKDVCEALGIDVTQIRKLDDDEKGLYPTQTPGGTQDVAVLSESGLYALVLRCRDGFTLLAMGFTGEKALTVRR
jgi:prophage antirepressor-like protein